MKWRSRRCSGRLICGATLLFVCIYAQLARADCSLTNLGIKPLPETGLGAYKGYPGGLYPNYANNRPPAHFAAGMMIATNQIQPLDMSGNPTNSGKIVLLSIGMSNTTDEWASLGSSPFKALADADPSKNPKLVIVDGAQGGQASTDWTNFNSATWSTVASRLAAAGVSTSQVQVLWMKHARRNPAGSGAFPLHAQALQGDEEIILRDAKLRYPNLGIAYLSSRTRAYTSDSSTLNPEPYAFESGFSVKWLVEQQIAGHLNYDTNLGPAVVPWLSWGPYLWADGTRPRGDGFTWLCSDVQSDFTHPTDTGGVPKVAHELLAFFKTDPTATPWFLKPRVAGQPVVTASANVTNGVAPLTVRFTASITGTASQVVWTFDNGEFSLSQNPTNVFRSPGSYSARVTVTGSNSNTASSSVTITVNTTFNDWRTNKFTAAELTNAAVSGASADPDGDGFSNLLEYAMGLEPKIADTNLPAFGVAGGFFGMSFPHLKAAADVWLSAESSTNLLDWVAVAPSEVIDNGPIEIYVFRESLLAPTDDNSFFNSAAKFYRPKAVPLP